MLCFLSHTLCARENERVWVTLFGGPFLGRAPPPRVPDQERTFTRGYLGVDLY